MFSFSFLVNPDVLVRVEELFKNERSTQGTSGVFHYVLRFTMVFTLSRTRIENIYFLSAGIEISVTKYFFAGETSTVFLEDDRWEFVFVNRSIPSLH